MIVSVSISTRPLQFLTTFLACDGQEYCLSLEMGGAAGGVTHDFAFQPEGEGPVEMRFREFRPMLRGRPSPVAPPLKPELVKVVSLRTQRREEGPFSLTLRGISGLLGTEAPPKPDPARLGRWACDACGTMNFRAAETCVRCGSPKAVIDQIAERKAAAEAKAKATRWECTGCGANNFAALQECQKCGAPRP